MDQQTLITHITKLLKNKNYEPLPSNYLIKYDIIFGEMLPSFQEFLIFEKDMSSKDLLICTNKALITQLRLYDALLTGKICYINNYQRASLFRVFSKDTGAKRDLQLSSNYIKNENSIKNSEEFKGIEENLSVLKENISIVENFLKKSSQIPNSPSIEFIESPIYIDNIALFLDESLNKSSVPMEITLSEAESESEVKKREMEELLESLGWLDDLSDL